MRRRAALALATDALLVVGFAALGRRSHDEDGGLAEVIVVAAPFLVALAAGWLALRAWRDPVGLLPTGLGIWAVTAIGGLGLRRLAFERGIAPAFVVVALITLAALLLGWRAVSGRVAHRTHVR